MDIRHALKPLAFAAAIAAAGSAQAAIDVYFDEASFLAAVVNAATDTFDDLTPGAAYDGPLMRSVGSHSYTVSTSPDSPVLYGAGTAGDAWLSTDIASDFIVFDGFSPGVTAVGAYVFGSDSAGEFLQRGLTAVRVSNGVDTAVEFQFRAGTATYFGFVSDTPLLSFEVKTLYGQNTAIWPTINDLTLAAAIPEPETYALMLAGLAAIGFMARRRRS
jgi:hypothetical protein